MGQLYDWIINSHEDCNQFYFYRKKRCVDCFYSEKKNGKTYSVFCNKKNSYVCYSCKKECFKEK